MRAGADIKAGQRIHRHRLAVNVRQTRTAGVERAQFALFEEKGAACFVMVRQFHRLARRLDSARHHPVEFSEHAVDFS